MQISAQTLGVIGINYREFGLKVFEECELITKNNKINMNCMYMYVCILSHMMITC